MKVHLSIDDVIYSFMELVKNRTKSVFDLSFYKFLRELNRKYGAVFTLYGFENYAEHFFINEMPQSYWEELSQCGFVKFGFHGTFFESDFNTFSKKCNNFYSVIPEKLYANTVRLHEYSGEADKIELLKKYSVKMMLCREDESRKRGNYPPSYFFTEKEERAVGTQPIINNGMSFIKTSIRSEFYDRSTLRNEVIKLIENNPDNSIISIYTHEKIWSDYKEHLEQVCKMIHDSSNVKFTF